MFSNLNILTVDSSFSACSIAILYKKKIFTIYKNCPKEHEKNIMYMIKKILHNNNININKINIIACTIGPGNFTGIRIAICISYALSNFYNIPLLSFSSFQIISEQIWKIYSIDKVLLAIKISKNQILYGKFIRNKLGIWIGTHTEKKYKNLDIILKKINKIKGLWCIAGKINKKLIKKHLKRKIIFTRILNPNAKYILSYIKLHLKNNYKLNFVKKMYPKYMHAI